MALTRLLITDFRNISSADLTLTTGFNGLIGSNGSGKSSLLEAIYTLGHGRGFHQHPVQQVIRHTTQQFVLHGQIEQSQQQDKIGLCKTRQGATQVRINGGNNHKIAELAQNLPIQLITPESIHLLNGGPKYRRAFLDWGCFHHESAFFQAWHQTRRLLQQRNAALKNARHYQALHSWDQQLVPLAEQITAWRATYSAALTEKITTICAQLLPEYRFSFHFQRGWDAQYDYATLLQQYFKRDYSATYTLLGPHRADLHIRADGIPVESHLSRGQLKLLVYALRLSQGEYFTQMMGKDCLYLLDDFAAELDSTRRQLLAEHFKKMDTQIIASAIDQQQLSDFKSEKEKLFLVEHGTIIAKSFE